VPEIRRMEESDLDEVAAIERASFPLPWSRNLFLRDLKENKIAFFLAVRDRGELVAYGGFWLLQEEINIVNVAVHPDHRKKGFGRLVLDALLKEGQKQGATIATLEVRESNKAARTLYERLGFIQIAIRKKYYSDNREDALVMWLNPIPNMKELN